MTTQNDMKPLHDLLQELMATSHTDLVKRAQAIIDAVEAGEAGTVGLTEAAAMHTVITEVIYRKVAKTSLIQFVDAQGINSLGNLQIKLAHQLKQSAAWQFRLQNHIKRVDGLGRNDSRVEKRIIKRGTSTADGCFDAPL